MRLILGLLLSVFLTLHAEEERKKILVISSNGGQCHNSAAQTLKNILGDTYDFEVIYPIDELHIWGVKSGEGIYNFMLRHGWTRPMNLVSKHIAPKVFRSKKSDVEAIVQKHIDEVDPNLVVSLIPFINYGASEAARKSNIPYLLITLDNDLRNWVHGLQGVQHPHFRVTLGADLPSTREMLLQRQVPNQAISTVGFPIRSDFFVERNFASLKEEFQIPPHKPVILLICGGSGGHQLLEYTRRIGETFLGVHLIACAGKNRTLAKQLKKLPLHPTNSLTVMGFTHQIADLMAISDLLITKPGPGTLHEAMAMRLPILTVGTEPILSWEKANIELIQRYQIGDCVKDFGKLETMLRTFLFDSEVRKSVKDAYRNVPPNSFNASIGPLIASMCSKDWP